MKYTYFLAALCSSLLLAFLPEAQAQQLQRTNLLYVYEQDTVGSSDSARVYLYFQAADTTWAALLYRPSFVTNWMALPRTTFTTSGTHTRSGSYYKAYTGKYPAGWLTTDSLFFSVTDTTGIPQDTLVQPFDLNQP